MIVTTLPYSFSKASPVKLHPSVGVTGYSHRWLAMDATVAVGSAVNTLNDDLGGTPLTCSTTGPALASLGGLKYLQFNGTSNFLLANGTAGTLGTIVLIARTRYTPGAALTPNPTIGLFGNLQIQRAATGNQIVPSNFVKPPSTDQAWQFLALRGDGTNIAFTVGSSTATFVHTTALGTFGRVAIGARYNAGAMDLFSQADVIETMVYPTQLTDAQVQTIYAAYQSGYPSLGL